MRIFNRIRTIDYKLIAPALFLSLVGLLSVYSSSIGKASFSSFQKQLCFLIVFLTMAIVISFLDLRFLRTNAKLVLALYFLSLISLVGLIFFGSKIRGIKGWYKLGAFSFDPVPLVAIILIIILAKYFSTRHIELQRIQPIIVSGIYAAAPIFLVLMQPDLGSALTLIAVWLGALIFSGIKLKHALILLLIFVLLFAMAWRFWLQDYQKQRILSFLNPQIDKQGVSWSVNQSKIAIGSGGLLGKGFGKGTQTQYGFLPEPKTDFIFSAIGEEFGFIGLFLLIIAFFFLLWRIIKIAFVAQNNFLRLFAMSFGFLILSQSFVNIGMCIGLFPVVGIPLPFVSYSGSQLLGFYLGLGILTALAP